MKIDNIKISEILNFYLQDMELEDKIMEALLDEDKEGNEGHKLIIKSLSDAQAECSCGNWYMVATGERTKKEIEEEFNNHLKEVNNDIKII